MPDNSDIGSDKTPLLLREQRRLLELVATGVPLDECLTAVCEAVPRLSPNTRVSILLADEKCLSFPRSISPDLPPSFGEGLKNAPVDDLAIGTCGEALFRGRQVICDNIATDGKWSKAWRDLCLAHDVIACVSEPIVAPDGRRLGSFMLCFNEPRRPTDWEQRMVKFGTYVASIALTRDRAIQELQRSEARYRTLFESIDAGFCVLEMTGPDGAGRHGFRLLEANPVFVRISRLQPKSGEEIRDLAPDLGDEWISIFERVALTGESIRTEMAAGDRWLEAYAYRVDKPQDRRVVVLFDDITGRKRSALNTEFLSSVSHEMTRPKKVDELMGTVVASIGRFMKVPLCAVAHIDGKGGKARALYRWQGDDGDSSKRADTLMGYLAKNFLQKANEQVLVVNDVQEHPGIDGGKYVALGCRSFLFAPGSPDNVRRFALGVFHSEAREWQAEEIDLVHRLARRIWTRLESARTEEAMYESERKLRQIFEGAKDYSIFAMDLKGRFTSWSPGAERLFGFEEDEILGKHFDMLFTADDRDKGVPAAEMDRAKKAGVAEDDRWHQRKDGSRFFASGLTQPIFDRSGEHTGYTKICRDCTASHQAREWLQRELADSQRLQELSARLVGEGDFPALMDEIMQGAVAITQSNLGTVHLMEGQSGLRLLTAAGFPPGSLREFQELLPGDETSCSLAIRAGQRVVIPDMDASECDPDKTPHADVARAGVKAGQWTPLISRSGRLLGVMATYWSQPHHPDDRELRLLDLLTRQAADLIERHQSEAALREREQQLLELSQSLELRVEQRTAELKEQTARLQNLAAELSSAEQRERKRVAALLHDGLQQLLVAAGLQLEMAAATSSGENRKSINQAAKWIKEARSAARDLTCQLRPPALYEDGLVAALHWLASEMEERHHLNVTICGGVEPAMPISDDIKALLFECVRELLFNVAKYARVNRATVTVTEEAGRLHIVVSDHGVGFDANTIGTSRQNGAFGLFSIRERLTALSGEMVMISSPGKGTRIELYIPHPGSHGAPVDRWKNLLPAEPAARTNSEPSALDPRVKVLVVDDHPMIREGIATVLGSDDRISVSGQASNGLEAIDAVQRLTPDVVLMDVNMPRMNGIEATREISRRWPEVRIIGLSVQDDQTTAKSMLDAGAAEFISKSSALEVMIGAILHQVPYTDRNLAQAAQSGS